MTDDHPELLTISVTELAAAIERRRKRILGIVNFPKAFYDKEAQEIFAEIQRQRDKEDTT